MNNLFSEFKPTTTQEWLDKINTDLKGKPFEKLIWKTIHGFDLKPFYRTEDLKNLEYLNSIPGEFPYNRGNDINYSWKINEQISCSDVDAANKKAKKLINQGVNSITFIGIKSLDFDTLLKDIELSKIEINFIVKNSNQIIQVLKTLHKNNFTNLSGAFFCDNLTETLFSNKTFTNETLSNLVEALNLAKPFPNLRLISINAVNYTNAGASASQEIAFALSAATEYLNILTDKNFPASEIAKKIQFNLGIGSDYFIEIAKIKSLRLIWSNILEAYIVSVQEAKTKIYSETSLFNKTIYDKYVNVLRQTTEAMSAILGGTDSLHIKNFDYNLPDDSEFAERIAKNIQIILKEEASFGKVTDPAAGSYYIENIIDNIINTSWELFNNIEKQGGFLKAVENSFIENEIKKIQNTRKINTETRKEIILGTNQYPNLLEKIENHDKIVNDNKNGKINTFRKSEEIEKIRLKTEKAENTPKIFLFTMGNLAMRKARAMFASNFFGVAGFEIIENNNPENFEKSIDNFKKSNSDLLVVCSSDDDYLNLAKQISQKINPEKIVIAGYPSEIIDDLDKLNIKNFIHTKSNIVNELTKYQKQLLK